MCKKKTPKFKICYTYLCLYFWAETWEKKMSVIRIPGTDKKNPRLWCWKSKTLFRLGRYSLQGCLIVHLCTPLVLKAFWDHPLSVPFPPLVLALLWRILELLQCEKMALVKLDHHFGEKEVSKRSQEGKSGERRLSRYAECLQMLLQSSCFWLIFSLEQS